MTEAIQEGTLIEAILSIRSQVDFLWQFFVTAHIAIFALLFIYDEAVESLNVIARVFALGGIALFEWINGKALANTYMLLDATLDQYRALYGAASRFQPAFFHHFVGQTFDDRPAMVLVTHSMAFVVILLALLSREFIQTRRSRQAGDRELMRSLERTCGKAWQKSHTAPRFGDNRILGAAANATNKCGFATRCGRKVCRCNKATTSADSADFDALPVPQVVNL